MDHFGVAFAVGLTDGKTERGGPDYGGQVRKPMFGFLIDEVSWSEGFGNAFRAFLEPFLDLVGSIKHVFQTFESRTGDEIGRKLKSVAIVEEHTPMIEGSRSPLSLRAR